MVYGVLLSLWWVDFNLYIASLGFDAAFIGIVATVSSAAGVIVAFPASVLSDRIGRRRVLALGSGTATAAIVLLLCAPQVAAILVGAFIVGAANQSFGVVQAPFLSEHSRPEHRNELFSLQNAIGTGVNVVAALAGGAIATLVARVVGFAPDGPDAYRVLLVIMAIAGACATVIVLRIHDDHPARRPGRTMEQRPTDTWTGEPIAFRDELPRQRRVRVALPRPVDPTTFWRLLFPGFLISLGAGQVIPFLNVFVRGKFGLELGELNAIFALTSLGTTLAILLQPALARRVGKISSVVIVQGASIPFLAVLGFSPVLWTVIVAMAIRNSLMNAGNPIFNAFAMEALHPSERARYAASSNLAWSLGWVIAGPWYSLLQTWLGFSGGFAVNFVTIIVLYSAGTFLTWRWFHGRERRPA